MSPSNTIKILFVFLFLVTPFKIHGATLEFEDKKWEINPVMGVAQKTVVVKNSVGIKTLAQNAFTKQLPQTQIKNLDEATISKINEVSAQVNRPTKEADLVIEGEFAKKFEPGQNGQALNIDQLLNKIYAGDQTIKLPVLVSTPKSSLSQTNNLGINELVAVGESDFTGSPRNRRVNIKVGADKFNGLIIKPGGEFSFNKVLGDVDAEHGFLPELVIKRSGVVPEFGGGLCQVSSTAFRAAMNAGLPIVERRNHSFAVKYYAPQGTDATIYPGVTDFRFTNNLSSHLLIRTRVEGDKLYYDFYGTKDDRKISFDGPYQYEKQSNGAMKAVWTRWVEQNDKKTEQVFRSNYQPPALFQQTTQTSTPNPTTPPPVTPEPTPTTPPTT